MYGVNEVKAIIANNLFTGMKKDDLALRGPFGGIEYSMAHTPTVPIGSVFN
jgi:hypothetical protein